MILALAGRRVDASDAEEPRFPLSNVPVVRMRVRHLLQEQAPSAIVCAAACGADLLALSEAGSLGIRRRVVLPFDRERFKKTSVVDRPGEWGPLYDRVLGEVEAAGDLLIARQDSEEEDYSAANIAILDEAVSLGRTLQQPMAAALIWDGISRGEHDITEEFGIEARRRRMPVIEVNTL